MKNLPALISVIPKRRYIIGCDIDRCESNDNEVFTFCIAHIENDVLFIDQSETIINKVPLQSKSPKRSYIGQLKKHIKNVEIIINYDYYL